MRFAAGKGLSFQRCYAQAVQKQRQEFPEEERDASTDAASNRVQRTKSLSKGLSKYQIKRLRLLEQLPDQKSSCSESALRKRTSQNAPDTASVPNTIPIPDSRVLDPQERPKAIERSAHLDHAEESLSTTVSYRPMASLTDKGFQRRDGQLQEHPEEDSEKYDYPGLSDEGFSRTVPYSPITGSIVQGCDPKYFQEEPAPHANGQDTYSDFTYLQQHQFMEWREDLHQDFSAVRAPKTSVHMLGISVYSNYIAQALATNGTPVTLLLHRPLVMQDWHDEGQSIKLYRGDKLRTTSGYDVESSAHFERVHPEQKFVAFGEHLEHTSEPPDTVIDTLIVALEPQTVVPALARVAHRLRPYSSICFVGDGMGVIERVNKMIFPDQADRPNYFLANMSHKLEKGTRFFDVTEKQTGVLTCSKLPQESEARSKSDTYSIRRKDFSWPPTAKYLIQALLEAPDLHTEILGHKSFHKEQLFRVAVDAVIHPISVAYEVKCSDLLYNYHISEYMGMVISEISRIIISLPELKSLKDIERDFSVTKLEARTLSILRTIGDSYTSFCLDVRAGKQKPSLDFSLGYLLMRADELGVRCPVSKALVLQVQGKQQYYSRLERGLIPFDHQNRPPRS